MNIHPIKTEQDYDKALAEIEAFWGADEGAENGDKLDIFLYYISAPILPLPRN